MDDARRSLYDIFCHIHSLAQEHEAKQEPQKKQSESCLCGKTTQKHLMAQTQKETSPSDEEKDPIYIERTKTGSVFKICPVCDPKKECLLCNGTGHKLFLTECHIDTGDGQIQYTRDDITPHACSCMSVHHIVEHLNQAQIPDKYVEADFSSFSFDHLNEEQKKKLASNIRKIKEFCRTAQDCFVDSENQKAKKYFVTLFGPVGCGKTLLATAALKHLIMHDNMTGKFVDFQYLLSQLRAVYDEKKTGESILQKLRDVDVLIIDEFGKGRSDKEWQLEKLDDLVNYRYNQKKITILTTNYLLQDMRYDKKEVPYTPGRDLYAHDVLLNETFWNQTLPERVGMRMYERIVEVSEFLDMTGLPSYRRVLSSLFSQRK